MAARLSVEFPDPNSRGPPRYKLGGGNPDRRPRTATNSLRRLYEGPRQWLACREARYLFSTNIFAPCLLTFVRRVDSHTFEGDIGAPRLLARG